MTKINLFLLFICFLSVVGKSQINAIFSVDTNAGCTPLHIQFTNKSTGPATLTYNWNFGGLGNSAEKDPVFTFLNSGIYNVVLQISNGTLTSSYNTIITVYKAPKANYVYTGDPIDCIPINLVFKDSSVIGDAPVTSWSWDFDDGSFPASNPIQNHFFNLAGNYTVKLVIEDANGCKDDIVYNELVEASKLPTVIYYPNPSFSCDTPLTVHFVNNSTGVGQLSYLWIFGDGSGDTSTILSPTHIYLHSGQFQSKLTVTDGNECSVTSSRYVTIVSITASFDVLVDSNIINNNIDSAKVCLPATIKLENTSVGSNNVKWLFGDGTTSNEDTVIHSYNTPGKYTIACIADTLHPCRDTAFFYLTVEDVQSDFTFDGPNYSCEVPFTVHATNQSSGNLSLKWSTTLGCIVDTADVQHPSFTFLYGGGSVFLTVENSRGCSAKWSREVVIIFPIANYTVDSTTHGCIPLQISFTDKSFSMEEIITWKWIFGNGDTLLQQNPNYTYDTAGDFNAYLVIINSSGCRDTSDTIVIHPGIAPHPNFSVSPTTLCIGDTLFFSDLTLPEDHVDEWHYDIEGHHLSNCIFSPDQGMVVDTIGSLDVYLTVGYNECYATDTITEGITIKGPMVNFSYNSDCSIPDVYNFTGIILGAENFIWNFGDGDTNTITQNPTHTFTSSQDYTVQLIATNSSTGCSDTVSKIIRNRNLSVNFTINNSDKDTVICCAKAPTNFISSAIDVNSDCHEGYYWDFGDSTPFRFNDIVLWPHIYQKDGFFRVRHWAQDINGCKDTIVKYIKIFKLKADFTTDVTSGCIPLNVIATNISSADTIITHYTWNWGDSSLVSQIYEHTYTDTGAFNLTLAVYDTLSCKDSVTVAIHAVTANAGFSILSSFNICINDSVKFIREDLSADSVLWDFGDGYFSKNMSQSLWHTYPDSGTYTVELFLYKGGCRVDSIKESCINVQKVTADFSVNLVDTTDNINCFPLELKFQYATIPNQNIYWFWNSGLGGQSLNKDSVRFIYNKPGNYFATLVVFTQRGCNATDTMPIHVKGPYADFTITPDTLCKGDLVSFSMYNPSYVYSFEWDFGDGIPGFGQNTSHKYYYTGTVHPILLLRVDSIHSCDVSLSDTIFIHNIIADFDIKNNGVLETSACTPFHAQMENKSIGQNLSYSWLINNSQQSVITNPLFNIVQSGIYQITLLVNSIVGCTDTSIQQIIVFPVPVVTINNDTAICSGDTIQLFVKGGTHYTWQPVTGLNNSLIPNPLAFPVSTTDYTVHVTDVNKCSSDADVNIIVQPKPSINLRDTSLFIGESFTINVTPEANIGYQWNPPDGLSCVDCANPYVFTLDSMIYYVILTDQYGCYKIKDSIIVNIREAYSLSVPLAFTPNGDGSNEKAFVKGMGIKKLIEFKIFNRWGQLVYDSNDINEGWDGSFNGKLQNIDTYIYNVIIETWRGNFETKKGYITILK